MIATDSARLFLNFATEPFYMPQAFDSKYRLSDESQLLWQMFEELHFKAGLPGNLEIPMESFTRAVEIVLKDSVLRDTPGYRPAPALWQHAVRGSGYLQSRMATSHTLLRGPNAA